MKTKLTKLILSFGLITLMGLGYVGIVSASNSTNTNTNTNSSSSSNSDGGMPTQNSLYLINDRQIDAGGDSYLLTNTIKLINRIMSMISVVTLVVLLIGGFKMITANGDEGKYKKGFTILKHTAVGLLIIGLSWAIIRLIFRFINATDTDADYGGA